MQGVIRDLPVLEWIYKDLEQAPYLERKYLRFSRFWLQESDRYASLKLTTPALVEDS
jgi:hypothetical protein